MQYYIPIVHGHIDPKHRHLIGKQTGDDYDTQGYVFVLDEDLLQFLDIEIEDGIEGWKCVCNFIPPLAMYASFKEAEQTLTLVGIKTKK